MAAPTLISYTETTWTTTATTLSTASVSWQTNDVLVVISGAEGAGANLGTPTATGLTFAKQKSNTAAGSCEAFVATAVAGSSSSGAVTVTSSASQHYGFGVWVWRSSTGVGNSSEQHTTTKTVSQTNTAANGGMVWGAFDFNADAAFTAGTPTPTNTPQKAQDAGRYSFGVFDLADQTSAGAVSYGFTGGGTTGPYSLVVVEVKNDGAGAAATPPWIPDFLFVKRRIIRRFRG